MDRSELRLNNKSTLIIIFSVGFLLQLQLINACPEFCSCKWKHGKQTVSCEDSKLVDIPGELDPGTQVLNFSGNLLKNLSSHLFRNKQLINLQRIYLARCQIKIMNEKTFEGLTNLVELDLSGNLLEIVPTTSFIDCPSLMRLSLTSNPIRVLKKLAFNHLSFLNTLELSHCQITEIHERAFQGLHSLEWLYLNDNKLKFIPGINNLPENLKGIELRNNPWECDCHLRDLHAWLKNLNVPVSVDPTCVGPARLRDRVVKSIPSPELACLPDVSPTTFYLELVEGKNVSLQCHVQAIPEASVSWWFRGQVLQNNTLLAPGIRLIYFLEEGAENKKSELFIYNANAEDNGTYVCSAENPAGTTQSNFTIKIIIKEDPIVIIVSFRFEYLLAAAIGAAALAVGIISVIVVSIVRCRRRRRREEKRSQAKECLKCEEIAAPNPLKADPAEEMTLYSAYPREDLPLATSNQDGSPTSLGRYHLEQNPDLINGMECRRDACMSVAWVDAEGYPLDYGLPKPQPNNYYRTLPYSRAKRSAAGGLSHPQRTRFSQDAEFIARPYENYYGDIRYTADGYIPAVPGEIAPISLPCCPVQWSSRIPANLHVKQDVSRRCVGAQTEDDRGIDPNTVSSRNESANEVLTESPDEGYEGEPAVV